MGKLSKRFNWKSRQIVNTVIDETEQNKIRVEFENEDTQYDASNALVLPSAKRKTKKIRDKNLAPVKLLSKKQRKKLLKITEKKIKNNNREALIEEVKKFQAKPSEMVGLTSLQTIQTMGRKKYRNMEISILPPPTKGKIYTEEEMAKLIKKKTPRPVKRELEIKEGRTKKMKRDIPIVQSESSSSSEDEDESDVEETESNLEESNVIELPNIEIEANKKLENDDIQIIDNKDEEKKAMTTKTIKQSINSPSTSNKLNTEKSPNSNNNNISETPLGQEKMEKSKRIFKLVNRNPEIQQQRLKLPILSEEHMVMEAINENPITIIVGPTGSGKTTQVPQFLYEAGYTSMGMIAVTEPRRIAAISMADRVATELNLPSSKVSYQIRYEGNTTEETEIKFMTDGVLFQEIKNNHYLTNYSAIIIDEVHERNVHSDILLGLLSRIVPKRNEKGNPLKLIIMSATPRIEDFTQNANLFKGGIPPVIQIPSRLFSVSARFSKHTHADYCDAAYKMVCNIHKEESEGGILVFLTGQQEINELCERLKKTFPFQESKKKEEKEEDGETLSKKKKRKSNEKKNTKKVTEINLKDFVRKENTSINEDDKEVPDEEIFSDEIAKDLFNKHGQPIQPLYVLPLYSLLPSHEQRKVFEPPPNDTRLCVISTNVAETSLTIPNIKYVVDSGKTKDKFYDPVTGISSFHVTWTSQASATQRAGRAGRTMNGVCYRLYSSAVYNDEFSKYAIPDIQRRPLDDVVLTMKALKVPVYTFPFPSPPDPHHLSESFKRLSILGALEESEKLLKVKKDNNLNQMDTTIITKAGRNMSYLPMAPRFAKMVLNCHQHPEIYPYVVILIAALSVREIMIEIPFNNKDGDHEPAHENWRAQRSKWAGQGQAHLLGDLLVLINAVLEAEQEYFSYKWCYTNGLRHSALLEYKKLRRQLTNEINLLIDDANLSLAPDLEPPTDRQSYLLAEVIFMGSKDQVARKVGLNEFNTESDKKLWKNAYRSLNSDKPVFISSASTLYVEQPKYVMYQQIYESTKIYLRGVTVINESWMMLHGGLLVDMSPPLDEPRPRYDTNAGKVLCHRSGTFGQHKWELKPLEVEYPLCSELFKWVAYFFLIGDMWVPLKCFAEDLYDPKTLISPIILRFREKRQNLIRAFSSRSITSSKDLSKIWRTEPNFLKREYFDWFENGNKISFLNSIWPPVKKEDFMFIYDVKK